MPNNKPNAKPAEPSACKCGGNRVPNVAHTPDGCYSVPVEPQGSEPPPPIDFEKAEEWASILAKYAHSHLALEANSGRAYLALKAERDALKEALDHTREANAVVLKGYMDATVENAALKARVEALTAAANRVVKRRNRHYKDVRDSVDTLEAVLAKVGDTCLSKCGTYEHVVEDQHADGCPNLDKEQEVSNG